MTLGGNSFGQYLEATGIFIALVLVFTLVHYVLYRQVQRRAASTETVVDDVFVMILGALNPPFYTYLSLFCAVQMLWKVHWIENVLLVILLLWLTYECLSVVQDIIQEVSVRYGDRKRNLKAAVAIMSILVSLVLWLIGGALILANLGIDPTTLIAGLGIGGIALALAVQSIVGDLFNYFTLRMDNPIAEGDFINAGGKSGYVTKIGVKTTRLKSLTGEEIVISNKDLTSTKLQNYGKAEKRGAIFQLTFMLNTSTEKLAAVPEIVRECVEREAKTEFVRSHLVEISQLGFVFENYYKVHDHEFLVFRDTHQQVLLHIMETLDKKKYRLSSSIAILADSD